MKILATDLDRTLLPNGHWDSDENAISMFNDLTKQHGTQVVYVTGRNLQLTQQAIQQYGVRYPHYLCGDVGTTIRKYENGQWLDVPGWVTHVKRSSPRWDAGGIKAVVASIEGLTEQEPEHQNEFKQSYYIALEKKDVVLQQVDALVKGKFDEAIVYSFDSQDNKGLLDFLPNSATKQTALEYVAATLEVAKSEVVFCGDSGNDIFPLTAGFRGVLVRNADAQLVENVKQAQQQNPSLNVYFAQGNFRGLSGYYTSGVIEGAYHYGIFS